LPLFIAGLFRDRGLAERVVTALLDAGVASGDISFVAREEAEEDVTARDEMIGEDNEFSALAVHSAWERLGWYAGARPPYRDKIAPDIEMAFVAAGPLAIAIGGAQQGATSGGIVGSMTNFGFPHELARQWYGRIVDGEAWVMVRTSEDEAGKARPVFEKYRPDLNAESIRHW
jgi:hypothetical protein